MHLYAVEPWIQITGVVSHNLGAVREPALCRVSKLVCPNCKPANESFNVIPRVASTIPCSNMSVVRESAKFVNLLELISECWLHEGMR
jgi:hypothetical protein